MAFPSEHPDRGRATEMRGPLDSILAYVDLLLEEDMSERESRRFLEVIRKSAARARELVAEDEGIRRPL